MKILLINPHITSDRKEFVQVLNEPLGLICLATYIQTTHEVRILDLYAKGFDKINERADGRVTRGISDEKEVANLIQEGNPDIIGIHCNFTGFANDAMEVAAIAKRASPNAVVVMGGAYASQDSKNILDKHSCIDYIVRGEGEVTFRELIRAIQSGGAVSSICGIAYKDKNGDVLITEDREFIKDIDSLPIPDRAFIDMKTYFRLNEKSFPLARQTPVATIMASRGCPYNCIFCSTKNMWGRTWRGRSPESVVREIEDLVANYGAKEIVFYDDQFVVDKKWVNEICDLIIERKINIPLSLPNGISVWSIDEELLKKMKLAGFYRLHLPIESGNENTLKFIRKPIKLDAVLRVIRYASKMGYWISANFIIGFPYETKEDIKRTIDFAYNCGVDYPFFFIAKPFPGSEMYDVYKDNSLLKSKIDASSSFFVAKADTFHLMSEELSKIRRDAEKGFMKHKVLWCLKPRNFIDYIWPKVSTLDGLRYFVKVIWSVLLKKHRR